MAEKLKLEETMDRVVRVTSHAKRMTAQKHVAMDSFIRLAELENWAATAQLHAYVVIDPTVSPRNPPLARVVIRERASRVDVIVAYVDRGGADVWQGYCAERETPGFNRASWALDGLMLQPKGELPPVTIAGLQGQSWIKQLRNAGLNIWKVL